MRIKVKIHGDQYYYEYEGEVLSWSLTVERFQDNYLQVPAVILDTEYGPRVISLREECRWAEMELL